MRAIVVSIILLISAATGLSQPNIRIHADIPGDSAYADSVMAVSTSRLESLLGPIAIDSLDVFIVASQEKFDSLVGSALPDWGAGVAIPYRHRIVIKSPLILPGEKSLGELVAHEFSHIALARSAGYRSLPRWLDEGLAMYTSAEWSWDDNVAMGLAVVFGTSMTLNEIELLNRLPGDRAQVAYSESYLAVRYLLDTYGKSGFQLLLDNLRSGRRLDYAFTTATGADYNAFQQEFLTYLQGRYNIITLLFDSNLLWVLLALVIVLAFVLSRLRRRKRFREMEEYDKLHSTDFDYGKVEEPDEDKPWS
jgi:hypothetical protein